MDIIRTTALISKLLELRSIQTLASELGVSIQSVRNWQTGSCPPRKSNLAKLDALIVSDLSPKKVSFFKAFAPVFILLAAGLAVGVSIFLQ